MAGITPQLKQTAFGPQLNRNADLSAIDAIKHTYYDLVRSSGAAPDLSIQGPARIQEPGLLAPPEQPPVAGDAPQVDPSQVPDAEVAASFEDPMERFAAFTAKYGGEPPPEVKQYFSALDLMSLKGGPGGAE